MTQRGRHGEQLQPGAREEDDEEDGDEPHDGRGDVRGAGVHHHVGGPRDPVGVVAREAREGEELAEDDEDGDAEHEPDHHGVGDEAHQGAGAQEAGRQHQEAGHHGEHEEAGDALLRGQRGEGAAGRQAQGGGRDDRHALRACGQRPDGRADHGRVQAVDGRDAGEDRVRHRVAHLRRAHGQAGEDVARQVAAGGEVQARHRVPVVRDLRSLRMNTLFVRGGGGRHLATAPAGWLVRRRNASRTSLRASSVEAGDALMIAQGAGETQGRRGDAKASPRRAARNGSGVQSRVSWTHRVLPSLSLNQAALSTSRAAMPFTVLRPGKS